MCELLFKEKFVEKWLLVILLAFSTWSIFCCKKSKGKDKKKQKMLNKTGSEADQQPPVKKPSGASFPDAVAEGPPPAAPAVAADPSPMPSPALPAPQAPPPPPAAPVEPAPQAPPPAMPQDPPPAAPPGGEPASQQQQNGGSMKGGEEYKPPPEAERPKHPGFEAPVEDTRSTKTHVQVDKFADASDFV
ncbi:unnamed protein product [Caenorhabditis angaria]|uniref:Uncharacterized protein n=1 Tax=Caenorhabditis angaria TaxID=860376 RepID=A0A9P1IS27_9PELO|nr:unnamed protein product [Caenorhabditis angaria]